MGYEPLDRLVHFPSGKVMQRATGTNCIFDHRAHTVWSTQYRYKVLTGRMRDLQYLERRIYDPTDAIHPLKTLIGKH
ncbi:hypothetical protein HW561_16530 [Rhodobacteraceae bacterium B1Z28]|uniref:Uncharacterized protein n=1 Tax=Ruegeria haliotis TaxID=2747601 RepID=A0ABX2PTA6_9RHOB|nr:hypothetical protein [Ruegeria haliotis]NVO57403.1 hypothetical protein [Ruegeria haliotis]